MTNITRDQRAALWDGLNPVGSSVIVRLGNSIERTKTTTPAQIAARCGVSGDGDVFVRLYDLPGLFLIEHVLSANESLSRFGRLPSTLDELRIFLKHSDAYRSLEHNWRRQERKVNVN